MKKLLVKIYVPTNDVYIIVSVAEELTRLFGGATVIPNCKGHWKNQKTGEYSVDNITIIKSYTQLNLTTLQYRLVRNLCIRLKHKLKQTCIAYVLDNALLYI